MTGRRAVPILAVALVAVLASATTVATIRRAQRAYCASGTVQYEYTRNGFLQFNSYADVHQRLCLTRPDDAQQFVDVLVRVTVQVMIVEEPIFEADSTWADLTISVDGRASAERCDFPELARMTPSALKDGRIGDDGALTKHCRFAIPSGDRVTLRMAFHGVELNGPHNPVSGPLWVRRDGAATSCARGKQADQCERVAL